MISSRSNVYKRNPIIHLIQRKSQQVMYSQIKQHKQGEAIWGK